jgi:hypothetical protein
MVTELCGRHNRPMQYAVVHLSVNAKDETALATCEEFVRRCREREIYERIELKIVTPDLLAIEKSASDSRELLMAKALDKLIHSKKADKTKAKKEESHLPKIFMLYNYPSTEEEAFALMDQRFKYPILDSVIQIVNKTDSTLVRFSFRLLLLSSLAAPKAVHQPQFLGNPKINPTSTMAIPLMSLQSPQRKPF